LAYISKVAGRVLKWMKAEVELFRNRNLFARLQLILTTQVVFFSVTLNSVCQAIGWRKAFEMSHRRYHFMMHFSHIRRTVVWSLVGAIAYIEALLGQLF
jgi:hypothetical protein